MSTRRIEQLLTRVRKETGNEDYGADAGIGQTQLVEYMNDGLNFIEEALSNVHSNYFTKTDYIDLVANQEEYTLPSDLLKGAGLKLVENKINSNDYIKLPKKTILQREGLNYRSNTLNGYYVQGNKILVMPLPTANQTDGLRVTYTKALNRLDIRRGTISASTNNGTAITSITVNTATLLSPNEYDLNDYICVVDKDGNMITKNIPITGINSGTGAISIYGSSFTPETGDSLSVTGYYVVFGKNTSTHQLDLDENVERFLVSYCVYKVLKEDSSLETGDQFNELLMMRDSIVEAYSQPDDDLLLVPEV